VKVTMWMSSFSSMALISSLAPFGLTFGRLHTSTAASQLLSSWGMNFSCFSSPGQREFVEPRSMSSEGFHHGFALYSSWDKIGLTLFSPDRIGPSWGPMAAMRIALQASGVLSRMFQAIKEMLHSVYTREHHHW